ncbi:circularly permuted type 2 ATP-grasp protein [Angustibacter luteus]|uniref:Circularly permuted type 2 ATP-grasp protein n=1 Tax=Angustibacter luteus TaxID=658456 RepID=A0ABW1JJE0_9ACTN
MYAAPGQPRPAYEKLHAALSKLTGAELRGRVDVVARTYLDAGVTFDIGGEERPFPLDVVPRVITAQEWSEVEAGVAQRVRALEAFLEDVYGPQTAVRDGVIPRRVVTSSAHFHRAAAGIEPVAGVRVHVSGIDLIRDERGEFRVLEDNVRVPSGVSYVLENRQAVSQVLPEPFLAQRVRPVHDYPRRLLAALRATAPDAEADPNVVVLTPGIFNSAYFEHALLARTMGVELVEGSDLVCHGGRLWMRTTSGERRVDVVYRRVDDEYLDPVHFRADSMLGCPGLLSVARAGNVTLANAVGNGVADDKLVYTYLPDLTRYYLAEEPLLRNVDTWRLEEPEALEEVLDRLDELVVKPVDGSGGKGLVIGPAASRAELDVLRQRLIADPRGWIAQPVISLSTIPTVIDDKLAPRHVDLRPFAVNSGDEVWVLPGGLTRVAMPEGQLVVNSSQGGGSKDTWVIGDDATPPRPSRRPARQAQMAGPDLAPDDARGEQQQQQQQQRHQQRHQQRQQGCGERTC